MTDEQRKALTGFLGECWHRPDYGSQMINPHLYIGVPCACGRVSFNAKHEKKANRTFTTWQDLGDLKEKIVEIGLGYEFFMYAAKIIRGKVNEIRRSTQGQMLSDIDNPMEYQYFKYMLDPTRFCELVAGWWEERKVKG